MRYQEILDEILNAIKGGADWDGKTKGEETVGWLDTNSTWLADVINTVMEFFRSLADMFKKAE